MVGLSNCPPGFPISFESSQREIRDILEAIGEYDGMIVQCRYRANAFFVRYL